MTSLNRIFPSVEILLSMPVSRVAGALLRLAQQYVNEHSPTGEFQPGEISNTAGNNKFENRGEDRGAYKAKRAAEVGQVLDEAWQWLMINMLTVPIQGATGPSGHLRLSRTGRSLSTEEQVDQFIAASSFPKSLLHPKIADQVWSLLTQGELEVAIFAAFKAVEVEVRDAAGINHDEKDSFGTKLMRRAFNVDNGPLSNRDQPEAERQALSDLFAGAIGSYKNPHSHRAVQISELAEAQEVALFASHLLRIVDSRRAATIVS